MATLLRRLFTVRLGLAVLGAVGAYAYAVEPAWLRIRRQVLYVHRLAPALDGVRVLHLSDLHIGHSTDRIARFLRRVRRTDADVVVITGDFIAGPSGIPDIQRVLRELTSQHTVIGVLGNHEHRYHTYGLPSGKGGLPSGKGWKTRHQLDHLGIVDRLRDAGMTMLVNSNHDLPMRGRSLTFVGIDEALGGSDDWEAAFDGVADPRSTVLLSHSPEVHEQASALGIPLVLSGHTHGGQVRLGPWFTPTTGTRTRLERPSGVIKKGDTLMHISPGLATTVVPFRFFARPEATVLVLRSPAT